MSDFTAPLIILLCVLLVLAAAAWWKKYRRGVPRETPSSDNSLLLQEIEDKLGEKATIVQFSTEYCTPCRAVKRITAELDRQHPDLAVVNLDATEHDELSKSLAVYSTPTLFILDREGTIQRRITGAPEKPVLQTLVTELTASSSGVKDNG